jgi:HlyD family secretion protein
LSAQGQVEAAEANVEHTLIRAPADGTITLVSVKVGEQSAPGTPVLVLQDVSSLHLEANVSEADIAVVAPNQSVDVTFDALGVSRHFTATVQTVNPASVVVSGVVNYKVTALISGEVTEIKPGMTANMTIQVARKENVLAVPQQAIVSHDRKQYVRVVDDIKQKTYHEVEVQTGITADGGVVELLSGLTEGQTIVTYLKP